ncbi:hypothetical protein ACWNXI_07740 [Caldibacillus thermoamylovorans]
MSELGSGLAQASAPYRHTGGVFAKRAVRMDNWVNGTYHVTSLGKVNGSTLVLRPE